MTSPTRITQFMILGLMILVTGCSSLVVQPTPDTNAIYTSAAQTIQAQTPTQPAATPTSVLIADIPTTVAQPIPTSILAITECQDSAQYISDDGMDSTTYTPKTDFTKTWRLKNTGTCTWDSSYIVSYISGTTMSQQPGYRIAQQGQTIAPNQTVDISIGMTSPVDNGNYQSYWGLKKENGELMPIQGGANGNAFYVKISVNNGAVAGTITAASIDIKLEQGSGMVCTANSTYFVNAYMTADGPTTATYEINSTAGQIAAGNFQTSPTGPVLPVVTGTLVFDRADTKTMGWRFVGPYPYPDDITVNLRVNGGPWHSAQLSCQE